ncbi:hypothetical protein GobsT_33220 [Gemmata obscuriglobus]|uniref:Uncharacterized protein n=1 Tax=Gemmata obscuriglobus TaxID=114 RepID=A0A2Z3GVR1_9BACT|nr:hypothetical protein C1280_16990 [Gemmata obscuriglobus]QEG28540.1 hypothetical protein GobsT_33220 [Gemmata obscuriglobus]VTS06626.1 unnamed protein product [Gemmata obscuriglobus UQM 2246]
MGTVFSYARLVAGSCLVFWGLWLAFRSNGVAPALGIISSGVGLAAALHETAYVAARYLRAPQLPR